ncbi:MAG: hypothetical protein AAFR61_03995 [Bacteroidota bacterium]
MSGIQIIPAQSGGLKLPLAPAQILQIPPQAQCLEVDPEGNIFLLYSEEGLLRKYLAESAYDSAIMVGGRGSRQEGLLHPIRISAQNRQNIFLLDDEAGKLLMFNINLRLLDQWDIWELTQVESWESSGVEMQPVDFVMSPLGDRYLLNSLDNKLYKLNVYGKLETVFGGLDYGEGSLRQPTQLRINARNQLFVSDFFRGQKQLKVYDLYGIFSFAYTPTAPPDWQSFFVQGKWLFLWNDTTLWIEDMRQREVQQMELSFPSALKDLSFSGEVLYLLWENEVHLYRIDRK